MITNKDKRDLELEKMELLHIMEQNISAEVKTNIEYILSLMPKPQQQTVKISTIGASDAN